MGDNSPITITLLNAKDSGVTFNVYTPEQIVETLWWLLPPIGRGTAQGSSSDLTWVGKFYAPGTYFVEVQNWNQYPQNFTLTIRGESVRLCPVSPQPSPPMKLIPNE